MEIGTSTLLSDYDHIHMLNGYSFPKDKNTVFKYMPIDRLIDSIDNQYFAFVSPDMWYDPFEQLYYNIDCSPKGYITENIACLCVSEKSSTNEDACWRVYAGNSSKSVRISLDRECLLKLLNEYAREKGYEVYIGKVNYEFEKREIQSLHLPSSKRYNDFFPITMRREHYLSLMLLKRKAFLYENEVRIFLVKDKIEFKKGLIKIGCNYKNSRIISNVMLSPYPPINTNNDIAVCVRKKINDIESEEIKKVLNLKLGCRIQQSQLYNRIERVVLK